MNLHHRRSIRRRDCDYAPQGVYFVTICTHARACWFGAVVDGEMVLNAMGRIVAEEWQSTAVLRPTVELDAFVVMPNHVHGIVVIVGDDDRGDGGGRDGRGMVHHAPTTPSAFSKPRANSLGTIVGAFKASVTRSARRASMVHGTPLWQRNYHEHIVRNESDLDRLRKHIAVNPARWDEDSLYSAGP